MGRQVAHCAGYVWGGLLSRQHFIATSWSNLQHCKISSIAEIPKLGRVGQYHNFFPADVGRENQPNYYRGLHCDCSTPRPPTRLWWNCSTQVRQLIFSLLLTSILSSFSRHNNLEYIVGREQGQRGKLIFCSKFFVFWLPTLLLRGKMSVLSNTPLITTLVATISVIILSSQGCQL